MAAKLESMAHGQLKPSAHKARSVEARLGQPGATAGAVGGIAVEAAPLV